ncbi:hypothetical protein [Burkholderia vietnamiensis]|uniref:hypothetical protein n=1 Tax=Burkholderia vietnamiensis TaxID=60552 RepID=UPI0015934F64|nr:hypothetical protein [Burkholderia vietnamiensis]
MPIFIGLEGDRREAYDPKWRKFAITCFLAIAYLSLGTMLGVAWIRTTAWVIFMVVQAIGLMVLLVAEYRDRRWKVEAFRDTDLAEGPLLLGVQGPVEKVWRAMLHAQSRAEDQSGNR